MPDINIELKNNNGFIWSEFKGLFFKGYIYNEEKYLNGEEAAELILNKIKNEDDLKNFLNDLNGIFSIVYDKGRDSFMCSDRLRTFPLFYQMSDNGVNISDDPDVLKDIDFNIDDRSLKIFLHSGFVTGRNTLIEGIYQVQAGEVIKFSNGIERDFYHIYNSEGRLLNDRKYLKDKLYELFEGISERLISGIADRKVMLPLSSGFDSRLLAVMLKDKGVKNVLTFTYGRKNNPEIELSRLTAEKLGFEWKFFEYNDDVIGDYIDSEDFLSYYPKASAYTSMFFLQEYFALKRIADDYDNEENKNDTVFIPGHSGDFIAGSHLDRSIISAESTENITGHIIRKHFNMKKLTSKIKDLLTEDIKASLTHHSKRKYQDFENWDLKERQAKFIINSVRTYEHFGFQFMLPLMDNELMDFFIQVDPEFKFSKDLYDEVLKEKYFKKYGLNFEQETNPDVFDLKKQKIKEGMKKVLPKKIINAYKEKLRTKTDTYFNLGVTDKMIQDLKGSGAVIDQTGENRNSIIIQWYAYKLINGKIFENNTEEL